MKSSNHSPNPRGTRGEALDQLLRLALDTTGAERAFVIRGRPGPAGALEPVVEACRTRRDDGNHHPSRSLALAALSRSGAFISVDDARDPGWPNGASIRAMALRFVLAAPLLADGRRRGALLLDSRSTPALVSRPELVRRAQGFARLIALVSDAPHDPRDEDIDRPPPPIVGRSKPIRSMLEWIQRVAPTRLPVLILGETGSGKERVSHLIHQSSPRRAQPYVAFNCTALTETLLEAELFGSVRGAYTGSDRDRRGLFSVAHRGTLLLDEVGDMPLSMQAKLLRTLEEGRVRPVGAERDVPVDVRVVGATHHDLAERVRQGAFRADLYHRLAVIEIRVPPLRERLEDLPLLVESLAPRLEREIGRPVPPLDDAVLELLGQYSWPGNIRELHAVLARAMLRASTGPILPHHLTELSLGRMRTLRTAEGSEREMIVAALASANGSVARAARTIGWTRQKLYRRIKAQSLERML